MKSEDRRDWWLALIIAVALNALLVGLMIRATVTRHAAAEKTSAAPAGNDRFRADSLRVSGLAEQHSPARRYIRCEYLVLAPGLEATLTNGSARESDRLGCRGDLSLARPVANAHFEIEYGLNGEVADINGDSNFQGAETTSVVDGWELARPPAGRQWTEIPVFQITIRTRRQ